jgi:hypothetical protein
MNKASAYAGRYIPHWLVLPVMKILQAPPAPKRER